MRNLCAITIVGTILNFNIETFLMNLRPCLESTRMSLIMVFHRNSLLLYLLISFVTIGYYPHQVPISLCLLTLILLTSHFFLNFLDSTALSCARLMWEMGSRNPIKIIKGDIGVHITINIEWL